MSWLPHCLKCFANGTGAKSTGRICRDGQRSRLGTPFPLTPTLSLGERESWRQFFSMVANSGERGAFRNALSPRERVGVRGKGVDDLPQESSISLRFIDRVCLRSDPHAGTGIFFSTS